MPFSVRFVLVAWFALASGCAVHSTAREKQKSDRNILTQAQLTENRFTSVYDAVEALRGNWLRTRGSDSFRSPSQVRVYLDNTLLGGVHSLREIIPSTVTFIRYFDGIAATGRWGIDHGAGVIFVSTHPMAGDPESTASPEASSIHLAS